jgi:S1-C subfamily serine protease
MRKYFYSVIFFAITAFLICQPVTADYADGVKAAKELQKKIVEITQKSIPSYVFIGGGSGVIISADGYALTNHHVIDKIKSDKFEAYMANGKSYEAKVIGYDPRGDIALLKLSAKEDLPFLELGDSDSVKIGQPVIALGNPFGMAMNDSAPTLTFGVISALHLNQQRNTDDLHVYSDAIQTDAPINPGNSGGPLITMDGKVIGINGKIEMRFGYILANTGIGYAIPANQIKRFLPKLKAGGRVYHGEIKGLDVKTDLDMDAETNKVSVKVTGILKGSVADKAGLKEGDCIIKADEYLICNDRRFWGVIGTYPAGSVLNIKIKRDGKEITLPVTLKARETIKETAMNDANAPYLGIRLVKHEDNRLVLIEEIESGSPAAKSDLSEGDIILELDDEKVNNINQLQELIQKHKPGDEVEIKVRRGAEEETVKVTLGKTQGNN